MIHDCTYPGCREGQDGKPALTALGCCAACQSRLRRLLTDVVLDFVTLKTRLPRPAAKANVGGGQSYRDGYGHPAEWASDLAADIRHALFWHVDDLAAHLNMPASEERPGADEIAVVRAAYGFLTANFAALIRSPALPVVVEELTDLHATVRNGMGYTRMGERLPAPCPTCNVAALVRRPPARPRKGEAPQDAPPIRCANCGHEIDDYAPAIAAAATRAAAGRAAAIDAALARHGQYPQGPACLAHYGLAAAGVLEPAACLAAPHAADVATLLEPAAAQ
jgi:hypothetical protein